MTAKEFFENTARPSAKELQRITIKTLQLFNDGRLSVREAVEKIGKEIGEDIVGGSAGTLMQAGEQFSVRAPQLTSRHIAMKVLEFVPREALKNYLKTGKIAGELSNNPAVKFLAQSAKISIKTAIQELANVAMIKENE